MKMIIETKLVTSLEFLYLLEETTYTELMHLEMNYAFNGSVFAAFLRYIDLSRYWFGTYFCVKLGIGNGDSQTKT